MDTPASNFIVPNKLSEYGLSLLTDARLNDGTTLGRCKVASVVAPDSSCWPVHTSCAIGQSARDTSLFCRQYMDNPA